MNPRVTTLLLLALLHHGRAMAQADDHTGFAKGELPANLPVALLVQKPDSIGRGNRLNLSIRVSLTDIRERLEALGNGRMRVTVSFEITGSRPVVHAEERDLPHVGVGDYWLLQETYRQPKHAARISILAEELVTGSRGVAAAVLDAPECPHPPKGR